jgi:hypothetical protein
MSFKDQTSKSDLWTCSKSLEIAECLKTTAKSLTLSISSSIRTAKILLGLETRCLLSNPNSRRFLSLSCFRAIQSSKGIGISVDSGVGLKVGVERRSHRSGNLKSTTTWQGTQQRQASQETHTDQERSRDIESSRANSPLLTGLIPSRLTSIKLVLLKTLKTATTTSARDLLKTL